MKKIFGIKSVVLLVFILITGSLSAQYYKATTKSVTRLFADKGNVSTVISYIPRDTELNVLVVEEDYLKVLYEESEGWILTGKATLRNTDGELLQVGDKPLDIAPLARNEMLKQKYGTKKGTAIADHKIWKGMTNDMVYDSWGKPLNVERLIKDSKTMERWFYTRSYVIFEEDILVQWGPVR